MIRIALFLCYLLSCSGLLAQESDSFASGALLYIDGIQRAQEILQCVDKHYRVADGKHLFCETYPDDVDYKAGYLGEGASEVKARVYSYLWPFSGSLSTYTVLLEKTDDPVIKKQLEEQVLPGLEQYYDQREPAAYASYINGAAPSDRFYDDNIWLGLDFLDLYKHSGDKVYLAKAREIWAFVESGMDDKLGGGIYWCEQRKTSKNTCSNAPAVVYLLKLYEATKETVWLNKAGQLYQWTQEQLCDPTDKLYWDNVNLAGKIGKAKFPYNTGQMIQAAALLYKLTGEEPYLQDAQASASAGFAYFFDQQKREEQGGFPRLKRSDNWFIAVMLRGYVELYQQDGNRTYIEAFQQNLDDAWKNMRDAHGLFAKNWSADSKEASKKWLLDQFALAEMYARMQGL